jgi:hypothetical protein
MYEQAATSDPENQELQEKLGKRGTQGGALKKLFGRKKE